LGTDQQVHPILFEQFKHGDCLLVAPSSKHNGKEAGQLSDSAKVAQHGREIEWHMSSI
jgi:hypothetical protein